MGFTPFVVSTLLRIVKSPNRLSSSKYILTEAKVELLSNYFFISSLKPPAMQVVIER